MNKKLIGLVSFGTLLVLPVVAMATISEIIGEVESIFLMVGYTAITIYFVWYVIMFLKAKGDPTGVAEARKALVWGVVGVMVFVIVTQAGSIILWVQNNLSLD